MKVARFVCPFVLFAISAAMAQNPVPFINQPVVPDAVAPGGPSFTLTVNGSEFVSASVINWNGAPLNTTFDNSTQLTATIPATDIATAGSATVTVSSPGPGGGTSGAMYLSVANPAASLTFTNYSEDYYFLGTPFMFPSAGFTPVAADFNGDGKLDMAFVQQAIGPQGTNQACIELGNGSGSFQLPSCTALSINIFPGSYPEPPVAADFNGDGKLDLVFLDTALADGLHVFLGNGDGTLQPEQIYPVGPPGASFGALPVMAVADFNSDGKLDLAVPLVNTSGQSEISIVLGNGDGTLSYEQPGYVLPFEPSTLVAGDFNRDGKLDLAFTDVDFNLYVGLGNGDGTFQAPQLVVNLTQQPLGYALVTADLNGDGKLDLVIPCGGGFFVLLGNGDGTFQAPVSNTVSHPDAAPAVADVNADGKADLLLTRGGETAPSFMSILLGNGDGTFQSPIDLPTPAFPDGGNGGPAGQLAGDFNGDGQIDILVPYTGCIDCGSADFYFFFFVQGLFPVIVPPQGTMNFAGYLGQTSAPQPFSVTNIGLAPLTVNRISLGGQNPDQFAQTNNCGSSIAVGASCQINVTFTPTVLGNSAASLTIANNGLGGLAVNGVVGSEVGFAITGTASPQPQNFLTLTPANLSFPSQYVGTAGLPQTVTVTNTSSALLTISSVTTNPADFGFVNICGSTLAAGASCSIAVFFDPTTGGTRNGTLTVTSNATNSPQTATLTGVGQDFSLASSGSSTATVSPGGTATYQLAVAPAGGFKETVSFTCTGAPAGFTCSVPSPVTLNGSSATMVTVTASNGSSARLARPAGLTPVSSRLAIWLAFGGLPGLVILGSGAVRRRRRRMVYVSAFVFLFSLAITWTGCGGGSNSGGAPGTYNLTVTGKFTSGATTLTHTTNLTLVVQ